MKQKSKSQKLTDGELPIMKALWANGPLFVRQIVESYPAPRPHQNTVATMVKILEEKGHVGHEVVANPHCYYATTPKEELRDHSLRTLIGDFFENSYKGVVSTLIDEKKLSVEELKEIIKMVEEREK